MGRHKTKIEYIADERMRQLMFLKRKQAINRKLWEISVVCGVECLAVYFASNGKMFAFSSTGSLDDTMLRYCAYDEPHEVRTVADYDRFNGEDPPATEYDHMLRHPPRSNSANASAHAPPAMAMGPLPTRVPSQYQQQQNQQSMPLAQTATALYYQPPPPPPQSQSFPQETAQHHQSANTQHAQQEPLTGSFPASQYQAHPSSEHQHPFSSTAHFQSHATPQQLADAAIPSPAQLLHHDQYQPEQSHLHQRHQHQQQHRPAPLAPSSYGGPAPLKSAPAFSTPSATSSSSNPLWSPHGWQNPSGSSAPTSQHRDAFPPTPVTSRGFDNAQHVYAYPPPTGMGAAGGYQDRPVMSQESSTHPAPSHFEPPAPLSDPTDQSPHGPPLTLAHPLATSHSTSSMSSGSPWIHSPPPTARHASEWPATSAGATSAAQSPSAATPIHWSQPSTGSHGSPASHLHHTMQQEQPSFASASNRPPSGLKLTIPNIRSPSAVREHSSGPNSAGASPSNPRKRPRTEGPDLFITPPTSGRVLPPPVVLLEPHHGAGHASNGSNGATSSGHPQSSQHRYYQTQHHGGRPWPEAGGPQSAPALSGPPPSLPLPSHEARAMMINRASDPPHPEHGASNQGEWRSGE